MGAFKLGSLRCYSRRDRYSRGGWFAHCIDIDVCAVGPSDIEARASLSDAINGFVEVGRILGVYPFQRRAPFRFFLAFWLRCLGGCPQNEPIYTPRQPPVTPRTLGADS